MTEAGLDAQIDGIGNVLGFSRAPGRKILAGSHIENQNYAGWLDGPLGVIYALEAARALREDPATGDASVDVVAFCDEEGHFGVFLGSRSFVGEVTEAEIDAARNRTTGELMRDALAKAGYAGRPRHRHPTVCFRHTGVRRTGRGCGADPGWPQQGVRGCNTDRRAGTTRFCDIRRPNRHHDGLRRSRFPKPRCAGISACTTS